MAETTPEDDVHVSIVESNVSLRLLLFPFPLPQPRPRRPLLFDLGVDNGAVLVLLVMETGRKSLSPIQN